MDDQDNLTAQDLPTKDENSEGGESRANIVLNLDQLIKGHLSATARLEQELGKLKDLLDDIFNNDPTYKDHSEKAKEASRVKAATKQQILKQPQAAELDSKIKTLKSELKETQGALSDYLQEFRRLTGLSEVEDEEGNIQEIIYVAKLVKRSTR